MATAQPYRGTYQGGGTVAPSTWAQNTWGQSAYSPGNAWYDPATGRHEGWGSTGAGTGGHPIRLRQRGLRA